jgi:hypothetical protein
MVMPKWMDATAAASSSSRATSDPAATNMVALGRAGSTPKKRVRMIPGKRASSQSRAARLASSTIADPLEQVPRVASAHPS